MGDLGQIFKAYDIRGVFPDTLDADIARAVGAAFARIVDGDTIVVAHDMRPSSPSWPPRSPRALTPKGAT